ncbi:MAG: CHAT domain-containing protein [Chitinivorax sp.]
MHSLARHLPLALLLAASTASHAIGGSEQISLAGSGRYSELRQQLEADEQKQPLKTPDLHALCFAYAKTKYYSKLMPCLDKLQQNAAKGDRRTRLFGLDDVTPLIHVMRADALLELAQPREASLEADKALAWYDKEDSDDQDIAINSHAVKALAALQSGNRAAAEKSAAAIEKVNTNLQHGDFKTIKAMAVARVNLALGNYQRTYKAILDDSGFAVRAFADKMLSLAFLRGENNWLWQELPRAYMLNRALLGMGRKDEARSGYDQLLTVPQLPDNGEIYWLILFDRGRIAESDGELEKAAEFYRKAIEVIEQQRSNISTEANKIGFVGDKQDVYAGLVKLLFRMDKAAQAFEYIERSRSRALVDMLATKQDFALPEQAKQQTASLLEEMTSTETLVRLQDPGSGGGRQRSQLQEIRKKLRSTAPELASLVSVSSLPPAEIQQKVAAKETLIEYFQQSGDFYAFVVKRSGIVARKLDANGLEELVRNFRKAIEEQSADATGLSQTLYDRLLRPLEKDISGDELTLVPHSALHYLPFVALHDGRHYVVEKFNARILPSASVLKYLRPAGSQNGGRMLIFGNPDLGDAKLDLPDAQREAQAIARQAGNATLLLRRQASESAFRKLAPQYPLIHIASHGQFASEAPLKSALLLSPEGGSDGRLSVDKLYSLKLNADLITLSACETGLGKVNSGDDVIGLNRGFLYAGASSIVSSLWEVDDEATSMLMMSFYQQLRQHGKREALRLAQRETLARFPHPYFWSAFYLIGNAN